MIKYRPLDKKKKNRPLQVPGLAGVQVQVQPAYIYRPTW